MRSGFRIKSGVDRDDDGLRPKLLCDLSGDCWSVIHSRIQNDFVRAVPNENFRIVKISNSAAKRKRHEAHLRDALQQRQERFNGSTIATDVEKHELVCG